ncbi:MAG: efflux RND transporter periplasmic adaptor subunit [Pseudomonadota bacterium]
MSVFKQLLVICLLAAIGYGGYEAYRVYLAPPAEEAERKFKRTVTIEVAQAEKRILAETVEAVGTTRALQSVEIVPEADGRVMELNITPGVQVDQGNILVRLDDAVARADLVEAQAMLTERQQVLARVKQLRSTNSVAQATLEEATARLAEAEAQLERARQGLTNRTIVAPFSGVVGLAEVDVGAQLEKGDMITRLDNLSQIELEFALPEGLYGRIQKDLAVTATSVAFPDEVFMGKIDAVDSRIDPVSRSFRTRAVLPNPDGTLPAGMFMSLTLTLSEAEHLTVPEEAIVFQAAETYVYQIEDDKAVRVTVDTGQRKDGRVAILSGLDIGDVIAVRGLTRLSDGATVRIKGGDDNTLAGGTQTERDS